MTTTTIFPSKLLPKFKVWLDSQNFTHFMTLVFNRPETLDSARDKLKKFHANIDRRILGTNWYKKPPEERTFFIAFPEHIQSNLHYHLLTRVNREHIERFEQHAPDVWETLVKSGSIDIQPFTGRLDYCLKEQYKDQNYRAFIISREFCSK
ncbi:MAG: hypothetical protein WBK55_07695 [Alphaproteobacteria bacterium]